MTVEVDETFLGLMFRCHAPYAVIISPARRALDTIREVSCVTFSMF